MRKGALQLSVDCSLQSNDSLMSQSDERVNAGVFDGDKSKRLVD